MTQLRLAPASLLATAALFGAVLVPAPAHALLAAPGCAVNADCAKGFECTIVGASGCAGAAPCAPGSSCPEPPPCEPMELRACTPAHCATDADCAEGMVCFDVTTECATTDCACPPDQPDCECDVPACDPQAKDKMCAPRYVLPCAQAADCGEGFTCEEQLSCGCSGSSGSDPGDPERGAAPTPAGGAAPADAAPPPDCSCKPTGVNRCVPQEITCTSVSDCPVGWTCTPAPTAGDTPACSSGDCGAAAPRPLPQSVCMPEHYGTDGGVDVDEPSTSGKGEEGSGTDNGGTAPPQASGEGESNESSACQMGRAPASKGAFGLLLVLGALAGFKRRRS